jgi:LysR family transcriptional regulator, transcriptional activator of the cysJI operon
MGQFQLNLLDVITFFLVAKEQSFSKAALRLSITQPAVTQHIHAIEIQFGVKLIHVRKKRVYLTKAGQDLLPYARELFDRAMLTETFLKSYRSSNLSIGIAGPLLLYLGPLIDRFKERNPSVLVAIREGLSALVEELLDYKHDICFVAPSPPYDERLRLYRIRTGGSNVFVVNSDYPLPSDRPVTWAELSLHPLIIQSEGSVARAVVLHHFKKRGLKPLIGVEVDNIEFMKVLTWQKRGVAFMYEPNIREEVARGDMRIIEVEDGEIKLGGIDILISREKPSPTAGAFLALIKEHFDGMLHEMLAT